MGLLSRVKCRCGRLAEDLRLWPRIQCRRGMQAGDVTGRSETLA